MNLGFFTMPIHPLEKDWRLSLKEDREAFLLADELGFTEAYVGEQEGFPVFVEGPPPILVERMDRHRKETQIHCLSSVGPIYRAPNGASFKTISQVRKSNLPEIIVR